MVEAEEEEVEEEVVVVALMALLRLWDMLYNDFERNTLMKNNWLPTDQRTDGQRDTFL